MQAGTIFCDLDGTLFRHGTVEPLPLALEFLAALEERGHRIIFVTRRGDLEFEGHSVYGKAATLEMLRGYNLDTHTIIFDVRSPRVLVDDSNIGLIERVTDEGFTKEDLDHLPVEIEDLL